LEYFEFGRRNFLNTCVIKLLLYLQTKQTKGQMATLLIEEMRKKGNNLTQVKSKKSR